MTHGIRSELDALFGASAAPWRVSRAPYRVSPLGAHTDHQLGLVVGMTLEPAVRVSFRPREDRVVRAFSREFPGEVRFELGAEGPPAGTFGDYLKGIAIELARRGPLARGVDAYVAGELPCGGVASSAALQVAFLGALAAANGVSVPKLDAVRLVVDAERSYAGVPVGLLDPAVILFGDAGKLVHLDCKEGLPRAQTLARALPPFRFLLVDSGVVRDLRDGRYRERVDECRRAAAALGSTSDPPVLRDSTLEDFRRKRKSLDPVAASRAEHVLSENKRVRDGLAALQQGDRRTFAALVNASGDSMTLSFGAGVPETVKLLHLLRGAPGVLAATYSGAGFGGSLLAVVEPTAAVETILAAVRPAYAAAFPDAAARLSARLSGVGPGPSVTDLP